MKISLNQQIDEIDRELKQRAAVYPRLIAQGKLKQSLADYQNDRLKAARKSLMWLVVHAEELRKFSFNIERSQNENVS